MKIPKAFKNIRIWILIIALVLALIAIMPSPWVDGVTIRSVVPNSSAALAGFVSPKATATPLSKERIIAIDNIPISSVEDYQKFISQLKPGQIVNFKTNKQVYSLETQPLYESLNQTINQTNNQTFNKTTPQIVGVQDIGLKVYDAPTSNLRKGLDLAGGTRVLLQPEGDATRDDIAVVVDVLKERLNVYGLSDIIVREAHNPFTGDYYIVVEIAGATEEEVKDLLARQGKFEAKIGNETVFIGGKNDITYVCRSGDCAGLDPRRPCGQIGDGQWGCGFRFAITLSPEAAKRHADITKDIEVIADGSESYLKEDLVLFLDDKEVDTLKISSSLKGKETVDIEISGSGTGSSAETASLNALQNMKRLQTVLKTGSLPFKISIIKMDTISPVLGQEFFKNTVFVALLALVGVALVVFIRYRKIKIVIPMALGLISELVLLLGFAALFSWNLDLASIAGIIVAISTGVNHLVVISDEIIRGETEEEFVSDWKKRIKNAMFIIFGTFLTVCAGMIPLWFAGAGLLKGFALTTIVGLIFGVFIARPAFAAIIEILLKE